MSSAPPGLEPGAAPSPKLPRPNRIPGRAIRKLLWKRLRVPRSLVHPALSAAKRALAPGEVERRRRLAGALDVSELGSIPESAGYLRFGPDALPGTAAALERCRAIFEERAGGGRAFNESKQAFLRAVLSGDDFAAQPELLAFMVSRPVLETVSGYLGCVPLLAGAALWWSPPNQSAESSQLFHLDNEDDRQVKVFLNVNETGEDQGPLAVLPADESARATRMLREGRGRLREDALGETADLTRAERLVGPAGSGAFVDTARCLHYGSRGNLRPRLLLVFQFLRFDAPTESTFQLRLPPPTVPEGLDDLGRAALGLG